MNAAAASHALEMNATGYFYMPAASLHDEGILHRYRAKITKCQIFMIGLRPAVKLDHVREDSGKMIATFSVLGQEYAPSWPIPASFSLRQEKGAWTLVNEAGKRMFPDSETMMARLHEDFVKLDFNVLYIGQVFGGPGARHAVEQLRKSDVVAKLQQATPAGYRLEVLMLEMAGNPETIVEADDAEMITLCEAALIKHFRPAYNRHPDGSFPSTKPRMLRGCAGRGIEAIHVRVAFEELPFRLFSETVEAATAHDVRVALSDESARVGFFG
jgi:hypothetical protein